MFGPANAGHNPVEDAERMRQYFAEPKTEIRDGQEVVVSHQWVTRKEEWIRSVHRVPREDFEVLKNLRWKRELKLVAAFVAPVLGFCIWVGTIALSVSFLELSGAFTFEGEYPLRFVMWLSLLGAFLAGVSCLVMERRTSRVDGEIHAWYKEHGLEADTPVPFDSDGARSANSLLLPKD